MVERMSHISHGDHLTSGIRIKYIDISAHLHQVYVNNKKRAVLDGEVEDRINAGTGILICAVWDL